MLIALMVLTGCLCGCGIQDWKCRKISNLWIITGVLTGSFFYGGRFWWSAMLMIPTGYWLYFFRMIGAGDLKLMALICGFIGFVPGLCAIGVSICICGAATLAAVCFHYLPEVCLPERLDYFLAWLRRLIQTKERIPYYDAGRDGKESGIPLGSYLCIGTLCCLACGIGKGVL